MLKRLQELFANKEALAPELQDAVSSLISQAQNLEKFESMKQTEGWKALVEAMRTEISKAIIEKVKGDVKIETLLSILNTVETKNARTTLEEQVQKLLPPTE